MAADLRSLALGYFQALINTMRFYRQAFLVLSASVGFALAAPVEAATQDIPIEYPFGDTLVTGQSLLRGQGLISPNGEYTLVLQDDGNLAEYFTQDYKYIREGKPYSVHAASWATQTDGITIDHATLQSDGNFVLYDDREEPRWASDTSDRTGWTEGYKLVLGNDGEILLSATVILRSLGYPYYKTDTAIASDAATPIIDWPSTATT